MKKRSGSLNNEKTLLVVTDYPSDIYSERVLTYLAKKQHVLVLAQKNTEARPEDLEQRRLRVRNVWTHGNNLSILKIFSYIFRYSRVHNVLFQLEHGTFGGSLPLLLLPFMLFVLKGLGKYTYVEIHKFDFNDPLTLWFYKSIGKAAGKIIILDKRYKKRLMHYIAEEKIAVLPMVILKRERLPRRKSFKLSLRQIMKVYGNTVSKSYHLPPSDLALNVK